jgi:hypothetical protein
MKARHLIPCDWWIELRIAGLDVKRGLRFYGSRRQLIGYLRDMNSVSTGARWDVDRVQHPHEKIPR